MIQALNGATGVKGCYLMNETQEYRHYYFNNDDDAMAFFETLKGQNAIFRHDKDLNDYEIQVKKAVRV